MNFLSDLLFALFNSFLEAAILAPINILIEVIVAVLSGAVA